MKWLRQRLWQPYPNVVFWLFTDVVFLTAGMLDGSLSKRGSRPCSQPDW
ncbi:hypothetical protein BO443_190145 [Burkholderia orbicola]